MTLRDDLTLFMISWHTIRTVPSTVLTSYTSIIIMNNNTRLTDLDVRLCWTTYKTSWVHTMVTAHRVKKHQSVWKSPCLHLTNTAPFNISRIVVLLITSHFTTTTTDTGSSIKMKSILFTLF